MSSLWVLATRNCAIRNGSSLSSQDSSDVDIDGAVRLAQQGLPRCHSWAEGLGRQTGLASRAMEHERLMPGELPDFPDAVESVSTAFTACVADYAFGDRASPDEDLHNLQENLMALSHTVETLENVNRMEEASASTAAGSLAPGIPRHFLSEEVPKMLRRWSRYTKELATFYQKRAQLEVEYSQKLLKLARSTTDTLSTPDASNLPSYSNIQTSLESDILYGRECIENYSHAVSESVVQPLKELTETLDRVRHDLQSQWQKECRKAEKRKMEALGTMYKARHQYLTSCEEEKAQSQQSNHSLDTAITSKAGDCEEFYKKTISVANEAQEHLSMLHSSAFDHINQHATAAGMRCQECISTSITAAQSLWGVRSKGDIGSPMSPVSPPSHKYLEPVTQLQGMVSSSEVYEFEELQRAGDDIMPSKPSHLQSKGSLAASTEQLESGSSEQSAVVSPVSPIMAWSPTQSKPDLSAAAAAAAAAPPAPAAGTNTASSNGTPNRMRRPVMHSTPEIHRSNAFHARDTATSLRGERSRKVSDPIRHTVINQENSPDTIGRKGSLGGEPLSPLAASMFARAETGTPTLSRRLKQAHLPAATESPTSTPGSVRRKHAEPPKMQRRISMFMGAEMSPEAEMHNFQRLRSPTKCCHCESYVYFSGAECKQCGIACHRKCLQRLSAECLIPQENTAGLGKRIKRAMSTFGINMSSVVTRSSQDVPAIVPACIKEVEERGLSHVGIYRLSGVKSKVEKLCQQFEKDGGKADIKLSTYPPTLIACVLKLFFRQLPEPLLTYKLYTELIKLGQDGFIGDAEDDEQARKHEQTIQKLRAVLARLPAQNFYTTKILMGHLSIVASHSKVNNMTESNLGIVFGPTIIQPRMKQGEHTSTVRALVDMPHQSKAVEFIIKGFDEIFTADLEPVTLRSVGSAEFLGSQGSLGGSVDDLVGAESADTRFSMLSELDTMCSLLEAVKEQRDIRAAINPGSEQCLPGADATVTDGKAVFSTLLPGEIDQMENALNHIKSESTESGIGSVDESEELIQFVKRRQEVIDQQAQLRQALHQQQGSLTSNSDNSSPSPPPNSTASSTAATNSTDSNGLPVTRRERKGSLPSSMAVETRPFMQRSQTQANLGRGQLVQSDDFFRQSTEEVIQQRRRIRKESQTRASPSSSRPTSDIVQLDSPAGERQPRLEFIEEKQDAASAENVFSTEAPLDAESHLGVTLPTFPESSAELCDTEEEEDDEEDNGSEQAQHEQHLNPHSGLQPITTYVSTGPGKNDVDTTVSVANPLLAASPLKIAAIRENSPSTSGTSGDKTDHEDDKSVDSLSFESDNDDESSVLSFLP
ncbi:rho GTPase-activating protein 45-like isoform X2 [Sycon ciliatum]|uniref:rho GTPase-activating protein 45-like isoform X2 n=1 Tax=Sycon ciliatum TaxID=27933 RepID=UPI0031F710FC